jgi:2-polyprenyl-3-methyl-5-hydroxy-6-metoxy-1,4-benzoquinol methylase
MDQSIYTAHHNLYQSHWWFRGRKQIIEDAIRRLRLPINPTITDIGSGSGDLLPMLMKNDSTVTSVESDENSANSIRDKFGERINITRSLEDHLIKNIGTLDLVTGFDVLEHIEDDQAVLKSIYSALKPGGQLVCSVPACPFLWSTHDEYSHHFRRYTKKDLYKKMIVAGFQIELLAYFNFFLFFPLILLRTLKKIFRIKSTDFKHEPQWLQTPLAYIFGLERFVVRHGGFPIGVSLLCIVKKP